MSTLAFRSLDVSPQAPVADWPYEGIVAAIERGSLSDWRRLATDIDEHPWGRIARSVEEYAEYGDEKAVAELLAERVRRARAAARDSERREVARRVDGAVARSGLSAREFARLCGTSATRLSTYRSGSVQPSAAMLVRFERTAATCRQV